MHVSIYVGIDLIGSLPETERGNCCIITLVDYFSKWPEAEPIADKTARTVAAFLYKIIYMQANVYELLIQFTYKAISIYAYHNM